MCSPPFAGPSTNATCPRDNVEQRNATLQPPGGERTESSATDRATEGGFPVKRNLFRNLLRTLRKIFRKTSGLRKQGHKDTTQIPQKTSEKTSESRPDPQKGNQNPNSDLHNLQKKFDSASETIMCIFLNVVRLKICFVISMHPESGEIPD